MSVHFQGKPFNITVIQVYALTSNAEEAEVEWFYEDLQDHLELTPPKSCLLHYRGLECKNRKSRATWSERQIWPWSTKRSRTKANRVLPREHTGHGKQPPPTTQEKALCMEITRNTKTILIIFLAAKNGDALNCHQKQDWGMTVAQITNSLWPNSDLN